MMLRERRMVHLSNYRARWYWIGTVGWILWFLTPLAPGWLLSKVFDELQDRGTTTAFWWLLIVLLAAEMSSALLILAAHRTYVQGVEASKGLLRANVLNAQLSSESGATGPRSVPVGDVLARLRDDPFDALFLLDNWVDLVGAALLSITAGVMLARIDLPAAIAGIVPLVLVGFANRHAAGWARKYRERSRQSASAVGDFLTAAFEASLTVKVAGAQPDVLRRFAKLSAIRSKAAVGDGVWNDLIWTINSAAADLFVGVSLLVAASRGLTAGEITLFASYLMSMVWLPMRLGGIIVGRRRYDVSIGRLEALVPAAGVGHDALTTHRAMPILGGPPAERVRVQPCAPLRHLSVRGLTVEARGVRAVDLDITPGSLTIVSGPVGSGKTTLLRAIIGLQPIDSGEVRWNDAVVADRAAFFVPPQCAYVAQVPRLFAESLADNLRLGHDVSDHELDAAIRMAAFDQDVDDFPAGLATLVGARGVRLSGGQAQRAAGARALVHRPELLVLDDLTSALDVETERELWDRLSVAGFTVLAASNRQVALDRADRVLSLG